jgi:hypothetical protein
VVFSCHSPLVTALDAVHDGGLVEIIRTRRTGLKNLI